MDPNNNNRARRDFLANTAALTGLAFLPRVTRAGDDAPPVARRADVTDDYYGTPVVDPYRWMENAKDPELLPWLKAQDAYARAQLARMPAGAALQARVPALSGDLSVTRAVQRAGDRLFTLHLPAGAQNFKLFVHERGAAARLLIDPTTLTLDGQHVSLDWWRADPQGRFVVYGLSPGGSEASVLHVMEVATGRVLETRIPNTDWGVSGWLDDGTGFFYQQLTGERGTPTLYWDSVVKLHRLNTDPAADPVLLRRGLYAQVPMAQVQEATIHPVPGTDHAVVVVGDVRPEKALWTVRVPDLVAGKPDFRRAADFDDLVVGVAASGNDLFLITNKDRPRGRVVVTSVTAPSLRDAAEVLPQTQVIADQIYPVRGGALVRLMDGGVHGLVRVGRGAKPKAVKLPFVGSVGDVFSSPRHDDAHLLLTGWTQPPAIWRLQSTLALRKTDLDAKPPIDLSRYVAERRFARARDGKPVPYTIVARRGWRRTGANPVLATAYGAYQAAITPFFTPRLLAFLDQGGVFVIANVRGGGEYGREWHKAGQKATKPNTWRDFIDVAQALVATKVTSPRHLVIEGASAGGIAVGRALTERPELFAGAISTVGWLNPLRYAAEQNNVDIDEWGPIVDAESFRILYAMDTYHAVKDGVRYPPVLVVTGYNDPRVDMFHAAKFTARLQAANASAGGSKAPVLLRVGFDAGHGRGSTRAQRDALSADTYAFVFWCAGAGGAAPAPVAHPGRAAQKK